MSTLRQSPTSPTSPTSPASPASPGSPGSPTSRSSSPTTRVLLGCGVLDGPGFVVALLVEGSLRPGYDQLHNYGSQLSETSAGWAQIANFLITGVLMIGCAVGMGRTLSGGRTARWAPRLIGVFGSALIVAGVFVTDPEIGYPAGTPSGAALSHSWPGTVHGVAGLIAFTSLAAAALVLARRWIRDPAWRAWGIYSLCTGVAVVVLFVVTTTAASIGGPLEPVTGLLQRLSIIIGWFWVAAV